MLLSTKNLTLQGPRKLQDRFIGPFSITQCIGRTAYCLDLSSSQHRQALCGIHDIFHVALLRPYCSNGMESRVPPIVVDELEEYEVDKILQHRAL